MNTIIIIGNIKEDPVLRLSPLGVAQTEFSVGEVHQVKREKLTTWFDVIAFKDLAEHFQCSFHKGNRVIITGRMEKKEYSTKDGKKSYKYHLVANDGGLSALLTNIMVDNRYN